MDVQQNRKFNPMIRLEQYYREKHNDLVGRVAYRIRDYHEAEDILHEAFLKACKHINHWNPTKGKFSKWFGSILENTIRDWRKGHSQNPVTDSVDIDEEETISEYITTEDQAPYVKQLSDSVMRELEKKDSPLRDVLYLYFYQEHTPSEIAEITGVPVATIKPSVWRFKKEMKEKFG